MITQLIEFDVKKDSHVKITAKEGDINSRYLEFRLLDNSLPFSLVGRTVRCYMVKPDKRIVFNDLQILDAEDGRCVLKLSLQSLIVSGMAKLELIIYEAGKKLSIIPIKMDIIKSLNSNELLESTNEFGALNDALWKIDTFTETMNSKASKEDLKKLSSQLDNKATKIEVDVERKRINNLSKMTDGRTSGDAELIDGRVGADGIVYDNIGEAIRTQIDNNIPEYISLPYELTAGGYIMYTNGGVASHESNLYYSDFVELLYTDKVMIKNLKYLTKDSAGLCFYNSNKQFISGYQYDNDIDLSLPIPTNAKYIRFTASRHDRLNTIKVYQNQYNGVRENIAVTEDIDVRLKKVINEVELVEHSNNTYIAVNGVVRTDGGNFLISEPIPVKKGTLINIAARGYLNAVSIVSEYLGNDTKYKPILMSKDGVEEYGISASKDMEIVICSHADKKWKLYKNESNCEVVSEYDTKLDIIDASISTDVGKLQNDKYVNYASGVVISGTTPHLCCTDYIDVSNISRFTIKNLKYPGKDLAGLCFYNSSKQFISGYQYDNDVDLTLEVPLNAKYMRFTIKVANANSMMLTSNIPEAIKKVKTIYDFPYVKGRYINYATGGQVPHDSESYGATDFIQLNNLLNSITIKNLKYPGKDLAGLCFYNSSKQFISGYQYDNDVDLVLNIPAKAKYTRFTVWTSTAKEMAVYQESTIDETFLEVSKKIYDLEENDSLSGTDEFDYCQIFHKIAGIGDSLMSGEIAFWSEEEAKNKFVDLHKYSWLSNLCKNIGATPVHYSSGGRTTKTWLDGYLNKMKSETVLPSAYYVALGTNDMTYVTLGTNADIGIETETFYGMYSKIIREIQGFNPHAKIFCCSLYFNKTNPTVINYCQAIREISDTYGCYYVDFLNNCSHKYNSSLISVGHFTSPGYVRVGKDIQMLTNDIIKDNLSDFAFIGLNHKDI